MKKLRIQAAAILFAVAFSLCLPAFASPGVSASHAILMDADSGQVLYEKSADDKSLIASTTKIMTGLIICERCNLDDRMRIPAEAVGIEGSSMYLKADEVLSVRDLLYGLLLQSGNDAAVALAIYCAGTVEGFVEEMNETAEKLNLSHTHFANPNGLDSEENYSTARDLAVLAANALQNQAFAAVVSTKTIAVGDRCLTNHNKLLWRYEGAIGVKTGYTKSAGRILVSAAQRGGRTLVAVTINAPDDWNDHTKLLDYGFAAYEPCRLAVKGEQLCTVPIAAASANEAVLISQESLDYSLLTGEQVSYFFENGSAIFPPLNKGAAAGYVAILVDGREIARVPVTWGSTVLE